MSTESKFRSALAIVVVVVVVAAALSGCGRSADPAGPVSAKITQQSLQLITPAQIAGVPRQTPFRAVLEWWRLVQYRDGAGALRYFTGATRKAVGAGFATTVYNDFGPWLQHVSPRLLRTETNGPSTTLFLELSIKEVLSPSVVRERKEFVAIPVARVQGQWLIADPTFYVENVRRLQAQRVQGSKR
jgi:hypothetical protein